MRKIRPVLDEIELGETPRPDRQARCIFAGPKQVRGMAERIATAVGIKDVRPAANHYFAWHLSPVDLVVIDTEDPAWASFRELPRPLPSPVIVTSPGAACAHTAFDLAALDYLIRPATDERLLAAIQRYRERAWSNDLHEIRQQLQQLRALVVQSEGRERRTERGYTQSLHVRERHQSIVLAVTDVRYFEAAGKNVCLHLANRHLLHRQSISDLEQCLDPALFARVHRSGIVNLAAIRALKPWFSGDQIAVLEGGLEVKVSRTYRADLQEALKTAVPQRRVS